MESKEAQDYGIVDHVISERRKIKEEEVEP